MCLTDCVGRTVPLEVYCNLMSIQVDLFGQGIAQASPALGDPRPVSNYKTLVVRFL
jgi:hypothetical protein